MTQETRVQGMMTFKAGDLILHPIIKPKINQITKSLVEKCNFQTNLEGRYRHLKCVHIVWVVWKWFSNPQSSYFQT